jgi:hypothetical protein
MTATSERFDVEAERRRLGAMTAGELRQRYQEIGGDEARSRNREYLIRQIRATAPEAPARARPHQPRPRRRCATTRWRSNRGRVDCAAQ